MDFAKFLLDNRIRSLDVARYLGVSEGSVSKWRTGKSELNKDNLGKILMNPYGWDTSALQSGGISVNSLATGHSTSTVSISGLHSGEPLIGKLQENKFPLIPIVDMGAGNLYDLINGKRICEKIASPFPSADISVKIIGNSMEPKFSHGDIVFCHRVNEKAFIEWGRIYVLDTENGAIIKKVEKAEKGEDIHCVSLNQDFAPFDFGKIYIIGWYKVIGSIKFE